MLKIENISVRYGSLTVLDDISFSLEEGQWLMVAGPNGAGKSTLVHAISQGVNYEGKMQYKGIDMRKMRPMALAREVGVLSQTHQVGYSFSVEEVVNLGRYAYRKDVNGEEKVYAALEMTGMLALKNQSVLTLSGGELQRVFLAQVFAQDPNLLILDEPTNHLDLKFQKQTFELIEKWVSKPGKAAISVVHDISMARAYGSSALLLDGSRMAACGNNREVLSAENLKAVYGMDVQQWMRGMLTAWEDCS
jgi:ABC-type cobalamin/Fe3+-siderophores transport systems, ATPase components